MKQNGPGVSSYPCSTPLAEWREAKKSHGQQTGAGAGLRAVAGMQREEARRSPVRIGIYNTLREMLLFLLVAVYFEYQRFKNISAKTGYGGNLWTRTEN
jgi:hypothetical protein